MNIDFTCICYVPTDPSFDSNVYLNKFTVNVYLNGDIKVDYSYYDTIKQYQNTVFEISDNCPLINYFSEKLKLTIISLNIKDHYEYSILNYTETLYLLCKLFKDMNIEYSIPLNIEYNRIYQENKDLYDKNQFLIKNKNSKKHNSEEINNLKNTINELELEIKKKVNLINNKDELIDGVVKLQEKLFNNNDNEKLIESNFDLELLKINLEKEQKKIILLENVMSEKDIVISEKDIVISEKDIVISEKDIVISEKDNVISEKDIVISEKDMLIDILEDKYNKLLLSSNKLVFDKNFTINHLIRKSNITFTFLLLFFIFIPVIICLY